MEVFEVKFSRAGGYYIVSIDGVEFVKYKSLIRALIKMSKYFKGQGVD